MEIIVIIFINLREIKLFTVPVSKHVYKWFITYFLIIES